jgi:hypothetical protein
MEYFHIVAKNMHSAIAESIEKLTNNLYIIEQGYFGVQAKDVLRKKEEMHDWLFGQQKKEDYAIELAIERQYAYSMVKACVEAERVKKYVDDYCEGRLEEMIATVNDEIFCADLKSAKKDYIKFSGECSKMLSEASPIYKAKKKAIADLRQKQKDYFVSFELEEH